MGDRLVFEAKANIFPDGKFNVELVVERTVMAGSRISLVGEIKRDTAQRERAIEVRSAVTRSPVKQEYS